VSLRQRYVDLLARFVPVGAVGVTLLLGSATPGAAREQPADQQPSVSGQRVSERLAAIREAVSTLGAADGVSRDQAEGTQYAQWGNWRNGPWNNWNNWRNWRNWHNW